MAVFRRGYSPYDGELTPERWRFWILPRYAFQQIFRMRMVTILFVASYVPTLIALAGIYISHNVDLLNSVLPGARFGAGGGELIVVNAAFFLGFMSAQATLSVFLTALIGPGLISPDLTNNALPLYFSRPFTRSEYILGKFTVLFVLLSLVTAAPMLLIYLMKSSLAGAAWFAGNLYLALAVLLGSMVWVTMIALVAMASSAWVRWRTAAAGMVFALFFLPAGFGQTANEILRTGWGSLLNLTVVIGTVWNSLFYAGDPAGYEAAARSLNPMRSVDPIPAWSAWMTVAAICAVCLLLLRRKIRAHEVAR